MTIGSATTGHRRWRRYRSLATVSVYVVTSSMVAIRSLHRRGRLTGNWRQQIRRQKHKSTKVVHDHAERSIG